MISKGNAVVARPLRSFQNQRFAVYLALCLLMAAIVIVGFTPTYFGPLFSGVVDKQPVIHFHGALYSGWMMFFTAQALLPAFGRVDLHMKLGRIGIGYAVLLVAVGLITTFNQFANFISADQVAVAERQLLGPLSDMVVFPVFFAAAVAYRRKPEIHKRLMLVATVMLLIAAVGRMAFLGSSPPLALRLGIWLSPIYLAMAYDFFTRRLIHPVYVIGMAVLTVVAMRGNIRDSDVWLNIAGWFTRLFS